MEHLEGYRTVTGTASAELEVKRSRFIATVIPCDSEETAAGFIADCRKKYWDARHNVYAFCLRQGGLRRYSDDGEPHSTAGLPVLETVLHAGLEDVAVVVTRYFGGVLLGTGGLVRAYSEAARLALEQAEIVTMRPAVRFSVVCDYSDYESLLKLAGGFQAKIMDTDFSAQVGVTLGVSAAEYDAFCKKLEDAFCGRLHTEGQDELLLGFS